MNEPLGVIHDTNSNGLFDLVVYEDGILATRGTYVGVALRAAGPGLGGGGSAAASGLGAAAGSAFGSTYEDRRTRDRLANGRDALLAADDRAFFMERSDLVSLRLRKRWYEHRLVIGYGTGEDRVFTWKPALNAFDQVESLLRDVFGAIVERE